MSGTMRQMVGSDSVSLINRNHPAFVFGAGIFYHSASSSLKIKAATIPSP